MIPITYIADPNFFFQFIMGPKQRDISTVIIVNKGNQRTKTIQVKTKHLGRLKHYAVGILAVIVLLAGSVVYLRAQNKRQEEEKQQLLLQVANLKNGLPVTDTQTNKSGTAQAYVQGIEGKLQKINNYLKKRGLKGFSTEAVGGNGNAEAAKLTDSETYSLYDEYLDRLVHAVAFTPMGYPRTSSLTSFSACRERSF